MADMTDRENCVLDVLEDCMLHISSLQSKLCVFDARVYVGLYVQVMYTCTVSLVPTLTLPHTDCTCMLGTMVIRLFGRLVEHVSSQQKGAIKSYAKPASGSGAGSGACTDISVDNILFSAF